MSLILNLLLPGSFLFNFPIHSTIRLLLISLHWTFAFGQTLLWTYMFGNFFVGVLYTYVRPLMICQVYMPRYPPYLAGEEFTVSIYKCKDYTIIWMCRTWTFMCSPTKPWTLYETNISNDDVQVNTPCPIANRTLSVRVRLAIIANFPRSFVVTWIFLSLSGVLVRW